MADNKADTPLTGLEPQADRQPGCGRRSLLRAAAALPVIALAPGCSLPVPGQGPPPELYRLTPKSTFRGDLPQANWQLILETPIANAGLNTTRIALQRRPTQLEYYARSGWADRAPVMIQTLMIESFENSEKIVSIGRESVGLRADFILKSELRELEAVYDNGGPPEAWVGLNAKLVQMPRRTIVASQSFESRIAAEADNLPVIIDAFDQALGKVLRQLVEWTLVEGDQAIRRPRS
ncbi:ABC-type transport auxiliary lipoprotein family protein [Pelagibius sp. CAU 1746]|uniref:ABC-type transport auxiliary lipoprotein family protein n=1 Tax=Pelagibius sp. CAU 1746 TaxID=3140370 RepID=UPI00325B9538